MLHQLPKQVNSYKFEKKDVKNLLLFLKDYGNVTTDDLLTLLIEKVDIEVGDLLQFVIDHTKQEHLINFLIEHGSLIVLSGDTDLFNRVVSKCAHPNPISQPTEKKKYTQVDHVKRQTEKYSVQAVLLKLLDEGIDPDSQRKGNWKVNAVNKAAFKLNIAYMYNDGCNRLWRVTDYGKSIGCTQYTNASVYFSQEAYDLIKSYFLNP